MPSASPLLPQAFWFRPALVCRRADDIPQDQGPLLDLPESCVLADFEGLEERESWAEIRSAWNARGIGFEIRLKAKSAAAGPKDPPHDLTNEVLFYIDTRDTRDVHRATKFCHAFLFRIFKDQKKGWLATVEARKIPRALADSPQGNVGLIQTRVEMMKGSKDRRLEVWFPAESLHGYDPETNRRLGLSYEINDSERPTRFLTVGRDFPVGEDPSLWLALVLKDVGG